MKIATYLMNSGVASYGIVQEDHVLNISDAMKQKFTGVRELIAGGGIEELRASSKSFEKMSLEGVSLQPPVENANKIICVGLNYKAHIQETGRDMPSYPSIFTRYAASLVGGGQPMVLPKVSDKFDFEGELAVIIGKSARYVAKDSAMQYVAGYSCFNDGSIRDYQRHTSQFWSGKNFNESGSFGPWLVTADEVPDISAQKLTTRLNGSVVQSTSISDLLFDIPTLIEYLSTIIELLPGDVIATGTPGGVGLFREPKLWMKPGDVVEVEISAVGKLTNLIEAER